MQDKYIVHKERHVIDRKVKQIAVLHSISKPVLDLKS